MTPASIDDMRARIMRSLQAAKRASGDGWQISYQGADQDFVTNLTTVGIKSPEQLEDDFLALFVWIWSLKDYIKSAFEAQGLLGKTVEDEIDTCIALGYVADIANRTKHGYLKRSRSGKYAELVDVGFRIPQVSMQEIRVAGPDIRLEITNLESVEIHAWVETKDGTQVEAMVVLAEAIDFLETKLLSQVAA